MADNVSLTQQPRVRIAAGVLLLAVVGVAIWYWIAAGRESTDDAQVDAHVTQIAARIGGTILRLPVGDNQQINAGEVLVEIDPRDYQVALEKARAELADAEANALAAQSNVPITSTETTSNVATAHSGVEQAQGGVSGAERELDAARARLTTAQARVRDSDAGFRLRDLRARRKQGRPGARGRATGTRRITNCPDGSATGGGNESAGGGGGGACAAGQSGARPG